MKRLLPLFLIPLAAGLALWFTLEWASRHAPTPAVVEPFPVGRLPRDIVFDGQHVWVASMGSDSVTKLAPDGRFLGEFSAGTLPQAITFDGQHIWVATSIGEVIKLSRDGEVLLNLQVDGILTSAEFDGRYLWVADTMHGVITKIHPEGRIEGAYDVGVKPSDLLHDGAHLWVANVGNDTLVKLGVEGQVLLTVHAEQPGALAFDGRNVWATNTGFPHIPGSTVSKFDTNGNLLGVFLTGSNPSAILYADGAIWVANSLSEFNLTGASLSRLSTNGQILGSFNVASHPDALAYDGTNLWTIDRITNSAKKFSAQSLPHVPPPPSRTLPVARDPGFPRALSNSGIDPNHDIHPWLTDFSLHSVPYDEIAPGGPGRDEIPPLDRPRFETPTEADAWLHDREPVLLLNLDGDARAYPLRLLMWHEIVNDVVADIPVAVTYCPLCNSAVVLKRTLEGIVYDFGTTGYLRHFDLIMWDRQTDSWWQQFTGEAIVGVLTGKRLEFIPTAIVPWKNFKHSHPQGQVLSLNTGFGRPYENALYPSLDLISEKSPTEEGPGGVTLPVMERVAGITIDDASVAFPYPSLARDRVVNYTIGETDVVVFFEPETLSPFQDIPADTQGRSVGATGVFSPNVEDRKLAFQFSNNEITDTETGTRWDLLGQAVEGPLAGQQLQPLLHGDYFWFAWLAFNPTTQTYP